MQIPQHLIQTIWQRSSWRGRAAWLSLTPFALGFSALVHTRNVLYGCRLLPTSQAPLPVISVGNLTVGGTGKTPFVLWLANALHDRAHRVSILTQGYKGTETETKVVGTNGEALATPAEVGDEAVMLARAFPGVVIAGKNRLAAAQLARQAFHSTVVILDDGFQHRQLSRTLDLLLINGQDGKHGLGNGWLLPAGPLREPVSAARRADIVIMTKGRTRLKGWLSSLGSKSDPPLFYGALQPTALVHSVRHTWHELPLTFLGHKRVLALASIADPLSFYQMLQDREAKLNEVLTFPDHHPYTQADWQTILTASRRCDLVVTTEKDLVKLEQFPFPVGTLVALRVRMEVRDAGRLLTTIEQRLEQ